MEGSFRKGTAFLLLFRAIMSKSKASQRDFANEALNSNIFFKFLLHFLFYGL